MDTLSYKTISENAGTTNKEWLLVDAEGQTLGRLASIVAKLIRGKHKPGFTPHVDCGDNVVVVNADKVSLSGEKWSEQRVLSAEQLLEKHPTALVEKAVKGMLPKNKLGNAIHKNLFVYAGAEHKQEAQKPKAINVNDIK